MATSDLAALTPRQYTALMVRIALGIFYVSHALLMWTIFTFDHAAPYLAAAELAGGALLLLGVYPRTVAVVLLPVALGTALVHVSTGLGLSAGYVAYLAVCVGGQLVVASGVLARGESEPTGLTLPSW